MGEQAALKTALSYYNTGHPARGFTNGYVAKVANAADRIVPAIAGASVANLSEVLALGAARIRAELGRVRRRPSWL
ncbi:MAG: hypothetical protein WDN45_13185 [Caulobacteraceae bacterium]